jgi:hypothetical protein
MNIRETPMARVPKMGRSVRPDAHEHFGFMDRNLMKTPDVPDNRN